MPAEHRGVPDGIWAVASGHAGAAESRRWAAGAAAASAWSFRRPACSEREAVAAVKLLAERAPWLAVHGRGDWSAAGGAAAVIAGARSLPASALARAFPHLVLGVSVHDEAEIEAALSAGAHFLLFGPVWDTPSKRGILAPRGLGALEAACGRGTPVIAIGGIERPEQAAACRAAGARGAAVLRAAREPGRLAVLAGAWR